jgi:hypothetical protein
VVQAGRAHLMFSIVEELGIDIIGFYSRAWMLTTIWIEGFDAGVYAVQSSRLLMAKLTI